MASLEGLADLIGSAYEGGVRSGDWSDLMAETAAVFNANVSIFTRDIHNPERWDGGNAFTFVSEAGPVYDGPDYGTIRASRRRGLPTIINYIGQDPELAPTPYYYDVMRGLIEHKIILFHTPQPGQMTYHCICRHADQGPFTIDDAAAFKAFASHLNRAAKLGDELSHGLVPTSGDDPLDMLGHAVLILNGDGRVVRCNTSAVNFLSQGRSWIEGIGPLSLAANDGFRGTISSLEAGGGVKTLSLLREKQAERAMFNALLTAAPSHWSGSADGLFALTISNPTTSPIAPDWILKRQYGLTEAEVRFARSFVTHKRIDACAIDLEISRETARKCIKALFDKTGAHSQPELMHLLLLHPHAGITAEQREYA